LRQPGDVRVHDDTDVEAECVSEHYVGGLSPHTIECGEFVHAPGNVTLMPLNQLLARRANVFRLVPKKAKPTDGIGKLFDRRVSVVGCRSISSKQLRRHAVHLHIAALRGQDGRNEKLQWIREEQLTMGVWVSFPELLQNESDSGDKGAM
jgi:hypothetical protein